MKQRITTVQLMELSDEQIERLKEWWNPKVWDICSIFKKDREDLWTRSVDGEFLIKLQQLVVADDKIYLPLLSIGQMLELLSESSTLFNLTRYEDCNGERWNPRGTLYKNNDRYYESIKEELCDALWECVKKVL